MSKRFQPPWSPPQETNTPVLKLYNSLTRQKEAFIPLNGKKVTWYSCGPTVYDASHMGHARSYITFDILRRVLTDYFKYDVFFVMNITDIDDKIIKRARQNYLFDKYVSENHDLEVVLSDSKNILLNLNSKVESTNDIDKKQMYEKLLTRLTSAVQNLELSIKSGDNAELEKAKKEFIAASKDPLSEWLDSKLGHTIRDNAIFNSLPRHWEQEFHNDMDALNVLRPNVLTRVSEYIPEIISYIVKIIDNGMAYAANGSVYFDVANFDKQEKHHYAKLVPEAYGDTNSLQEGEGDLTSSDVQNEKRSPNDFALWKKSKAGEPSWDSPWGKGRPGWHIECSAMASAIFGSTLDIHTGGIDLKFPHHDNEIAQSEAHFGESEWVKYFLHSGHLTIAGCKMSKSLKNFVSIQDALSKYTARQLRFAFLLHSWRDTLDYSQNTMESALQIEKLFNEFFLNVKNEIRNASQSGSFVTKWDDHEMRLMELLLKSKEEVHAALCDNIDTRSSLDILRELVLGGNVYLRDKKPPNCELLEDIALYVTRILSVFGVINEPPKVGFPISNNATSDYESIVMPYLTILSEFREKVRTQARTVKENEILKLCDELRDEILPNVGVRLEDKEGEVTAVKLVNRDILMREKEAKKQAELEKQRKKEERQAALLAAQAEKEALMKIPPMEFFKRETDKYSKFDDKGLPTHDMEGKEISKGQLKKLQKLLQQQEKRYNEYLSSNTNSSS
ncbi:cysteine--tRNA ligase, cytoplasmic [Coccinella septempunctata]|uniref:cysteine--tRNA ligase, cytoplasmic n=1 Tax=Coccinella septempunctata TaxID=41139 RepID=UPI001D072581|nr:cysteine--tRNA ligase, cytoplasmic [Coccinella septempunctata]